MPLLMCKHPVIMLEKFHTSMWEPNLGSDFLRYISHPCQLCHHFSGTDFCVAIGLALLLITLETGLTIEVARHESSITFSDLE